MKGSVPLFKDEYLEWLKNKGRELIKVDAEAGDFVIWDSRTMHHASFPECDVTQTVFHICYTPTSFGKPEDLKLKGSCF